ncbi:hypothetical protein [Arthrobacter sp. ISL-28]|uniref:hypothetical protein n=1 Tax=Arthrobacter sp. ISL-28 TaxID=2819108 RepID=UPI001BE5DC7B|nr:hypothetical protein [Arthrobacter sp. ISL-28]MBT2523243.1 hypothetical protein [Arthrobacter sp. ISL-28]
MEPDHIRYEPAKDNWRDFLYTQVSFAPVAQLDHILRAAQEHFPDDPWIQEDPWELEVCIRDVANGHLKDQTGMNAYISAHHSAAVRLVTLVPEPLWERPPIYGGRGPISMVSRSGR